MCRLTILSLFTIYLNQKETFKTNIVVCSVSCRKTERFPGPFGMFLHILFHFWSRVATGCGSQPTATFQPSSAKELAPHLKPPKSNCPLHFTNVIKDKQSWEEGKPYKLIAQSHVWPLTDLWHEREAIGSKMFASSLGCRTHSPGQSHKGPQIENPDNVSDMSSVQPAELDRDLITLKAKVFSITADWSSFMHYSQISVTYILNQNPLFILHPANVQAVPLKRH